MRQYVDRLVDVIVAELPDIISWMEFTGNSGTRRVAHNFSASVTAWVNRVVMDAMLLVEHIVLDMVIGWWTRILGCVAVVGCNFGLPGYKNPAIYRATARLLAIFLISS